MSDARSSSRPRSTARTPKDRNPNVPITPEEIRADATLPRRGRDHHPRAQPRHPAERRAGGRRATSTRGQPLLAERPDALWYPTRASRRPGGEARARAADRRERCRCSWPRSTPARPTSVRPAPTAPRGRRVRQLVRRHPPGVRVLRRAPIGPQLAIYEPGFLQCVLTYHRAGRLPAGAMVKLYFGGEWGMWARAGRDLRAAAHRRRARSRTSTCSRAPTCRGRCRCGAATSWPRRWPASRSSGAATSTSASRSTSIPTQADQRRAGRAGGGAGGVGRPPARHHRRRDQPARPAESSEPRNASSAALTCAGSSCWIQCPESAIHTGSRRLGTAARVASTASGVWPKMASTRRR